MQDGKIRLSLSKYHKNRFQIRDGYLYLSVSNFVTNRSIKTLEIGPLGYGRFDLHIKYEETALEAASPQPGDNTLALDPGVSNFCTAASTLGDAFILSGLEMKSVNRQWNKNKARLQSEMDLTEDKWRKERLREELTNSTLKRNRRIQDIIHKMSHNLIEYAVENGISCIVAGYNEGWKHEVNIGSANNQKFVCIPHRRFLDYVKYKAARYGIEFRVQEESYTSSCDSLALETIEKHEKYMGRRKHRGLYKSSTGRALNADVNGALNILRKHLFSNVKKSKGKDESEVIARIVSMGRVFRPRKTAWGSSPCSPKPSSKGFGIHMPAPLGAGS
ncbi:MAG TPA: transposase [Oligoflexus sp.]|uniref:RNA-guided endonuclease InsQ/TnpB family protein n=1 Tax=Oligoflexus sp. TaxID=1971216 RepID=UPI002D44D0DF|nr:transposase [Oligoflexus sp.]HYX31890.1 transposase [Oligoflexus sp.]